MREFDFRMRVSTIKPRYLEVFDALMQAGSITHAAARLGLSQPAVSIALAQFEREIGFRLFHRSRGYFAPTAEAKLLHPEVEGGLLALARIAGRAREIRTGGYGVVRIASNGTAAINLLPWIISGYQREHPGVRVELHVRTSGQVAALVAGRQFEIGLLDAPVPVPGLDVELITFTCVCLLLEDDPLAGEPLLTPAHLADRPVVALTGNHGIDRQVQEAFSVAGVPLLRQATVAYFAIARNMVRAGGGVALVDPVNATAPGSEGLVWRPFHPRIHYQLAMVTPAGVSVPKAAASLLAELRTALRQKTETGTPP